MEGYVDISHLPKSLPEELHSITLQNPNKTQIDIYGGSIEPITSRFRVITLVGKTTPQNPP